MRKKFAPVHFLTTEEAKYFFKFSPKTYSVHEECGCSDNSDGNFCSQDRSYQVLLKLFQFFSQRVPLVTQSNALTELDEIFGYFKRLFVFCFLLDNFLQKFRIDLQNAFSQRLRFFCSRCESFFAQSPKVKNNLIRSRYLTVFSQERFSGHGGGSIDNTSRKFSLKMEKIFLENRSKKMTFRKLLSQKVSVNMENVVSTRLPKTYQAYIKNSFCSIPEMLIGFGLETKVSKLLLCTQRMQFGQHSEKMLLKVPKSFPQDRKALKNYEFGTGAELFLLTFLEKSNLLDFSVQISPKTIQLTLRMRC